MSSPSGSSLPENNYYSLLFLDCLILKVKALCPSEQWEPPMQQHTITLQKTWNFSSAAVSTLGVALLKICVIRKVLLEFWPLHITCLLLWFVLLVEMWFALEVFFDIKLYLRCEFKFFIHPCILWLERVCWHLGGIFSNQGEISWCCLLTLEVSYSILDIFYE